MKINLLPVSKNAFSLYFLLIIPSLGFCQLTHDWNKKWSFGIMMGTTISKYSFSSSYGSGLPAKSIKALNIGGIVKRRFNESLSMVGEVNLTSEGTSWDQPASFQETADAGASLSSINVPVYVEYKPFHKSDNRNSFAINAGINNQVVIASGLATDFYDDLPNDFVYIGTESRSMDAKTYGLSGLVGLSYYFPLFNSEFKLSSNYFMGLTNLMRSDKLKQNTFMLNIGYIF